MGQMNKWNPVLRGAAAVKVLIDHHLDPEPAFDHTFSPIRACSTSELIYRSSSVWADGGQVSAKHPPNASIAES